MTVVCPMCGVDANRIIDSRPTDGGKVDRRRHECACGVRWTSRATVEIGSIKSPISGGSGVVRTTMDGGQTSKPPPTNGGQPHTNSGGGVGGGPPSGQGSISLVHSDPNPSSPENPKRGRARSKSPAKVPTVFTALVNAFVGAWEIAYEEKYPFEPRDAVGVASMLKAHPEYGDPEVWQDMCGRYLADDFWGRKRHPLIGLATKAREFAGPAGSGLPAKVAASRETTRSWAARGTR